MYVIQLACIASDVYCQKERERECECVCVCCICKPSMYIDVFAFNSLIHSYLKEKKTYQVFRWLSHLC